MPDPGDVWSKDAVIRSLDIETVNDPDGRDVGDVAGIISGCDRPYTPGASGR